MADENISIKVTVDGTEAAAQGLNKVSESTARLGEATSKSGAVMGELRQGIGGIGQALSALDPSISRSVGAIQGLGTSVMSSMSSMGPWGILIGTVTAGIGYMASGIAEADAEAKRWTDTLRNQTIPTLEELINKIQSAERARALMSQRALNVAGPTDAIARQNQIAGRIGSAIGRREELLNGRGINDLSSDEVSQLNAINAELNRLRAQNQRALSEVREAVATERQIQQDEAEDFVAQAVERGRQSRRRQGGGRGAQRDGRDLLEQLYGRYGEHDDIVSGLSGDESAIYGRGDVTSRSLMGKGAPRPTIGTKSAGAGGDMKGKDEIEMWNAASKATLDTLKALADGEAVLRKERLLGLGKEAAWKAAYALAEAAGMAIFNPPGMAAKLAEAAQFGAIAAALGAGGAALGGGGGSSAPRARPDRIGGAASGGGPVTIVNNLNAPAMVTEGSLAELGRSIMVATHAAQRAA